MGVVDDAVAFMLKIANDPNCGYDQAFRWGPDYDCSSAIISAYAPTGVKAAGAQTTRDMADIFKKCGFKDVTSQVDFNTQAGLARGDVLLRSGHVVMYLGQNQIVHASINEKGTTKGGKTGDQTGKEICVAAYSRSTWHTALRWPDGQSVNLGGADVSGSSSDVTPMIIVEDTTVFQQYSTYITTEQYRESLSEGLRVEDLRGIFGMPHQFLQNTDPRIDGSKNAYSFGRKYAEKIIAPMPLLLMTPGLPGFMVGYNQKQKESLLEQFITDKIEDSVLSNLTDKKNGKYYSLKFAYTDYFHYVNAMLRSAAFFLGIQNETVDNKTLGTMNWLFGPPGPDSDIFGHEGLGKFLGTYAGAVPFYVDSETSVNDSFSNSTSQSSISSSINGISEKGKELNFLIGNVGGMAGVDWFDQNNLESNIENVTSEVNRLLGNNNVLANIVGSAQTLLAGGRMVFPEIWSDSSFSRSYGIKMKFVSPSGSKLDVFLNVLVPIYHLIAFVLPRQSEGQTYFSPFLVRAFYKGLFNVDMGIITDLSVTKGAEGEWTIDGLPTVAEVSFDIKDLYEGFFMSKQTVAKDYTGILSNISELDYIANSCGVNINEPDVRRTVEMYFTLGFTTKVKDTFTIGIFGNIMQHFNQKLNDIFGKF